MSSKLSTMLNNDWGANPSFHPQANHLKVHLQTHPACWLAWSWQPLYSRCLSPWESCALQWWVRWWANPSRIPACRSLTPSWGTVSSDRAGRYKNTTRSASPLPKHNSIKLFRSLLDTNCLNDKSRLKSVAFPNVTYKVKLNFEWGVWHRKYVGVATSVIENINKGRGCCFSAQFSLEGDS